MDLAGKPLARAFAVRHALLDEYTADGFVAAFEQLIAQVDPQLVLFPHTYQVRDFAPRLAARFGQSLIADVIAINLESGRPGVRPPAIAGKTECGLCPHRQRVLASPPFRRALSAPTRWPPVRCTVEEFVPHIEASQIRTQPGERFRESAQTVDLAAASLIVSVGRGIKEEANIPIVEELAATLGAELAASRPICDNGWLPMERQVGSSGQTVSPKVYIAVGISGAIQHLVGMKGSKAVVAINKDENAPIFEVADYGIVGDLFEVVPALTAAVRKARGA